MDHRQTLHTALAGCLVALVVLIAVSVLVLGADPAPGQEQFETIRDPAAYTAALIAVSAGLRQVLFLDGLFMLAYTVAIGFAVLAFAERCRPAAWLGGAGIVAVMLLDALENATMAQSLDIAALSGEVTLQRIAWQAQVSAMKWQAAAATLLAVSFVLPSDSLVEKLLVWGVRLGLPIAVPLFVMGAWDMRETAGLLLLASMAGGFVLLALVLRGRLARR